MLGEPKYDIAISFLFRDEALALQLYDQLKDEFEVFVFSKRQEELAGSDGLEEFRTAFYEGSRLVIVLYRNGWGETPWTRIERTAIEERILREGAEFLLFVVLEKDAVPPRWLPTTRIRLNFADFGFAELLGAAKHRAVLLGGLQKPKDPLAHARRVSKSISFGNERQRLFDSEEGVIAATGAAGEIYDELDRLAEGAADTPNLKFTAQGQGPYYVLTNGRVSVRVSWHCPVINIIEKTSRLTIWDMNGRVPLPGKSATWWPKAKELAESSFYPDFTPAYGWCWRDTSGKHLPSSDVAQFIFTRFLNLLERGARGEIPSLLDE